MITNIINDMRNLFFTILLILFVFVGCNETENKEFHSFIKQLPLLETPIKFESRKEYPYEIFSLDNNSFFRKLHEELGFGVMGKIFETNKFIAVLGNVPSDTGTPIILTFDKNGKKIDSHFVFTTVGSDMGFYTWNKEVILPDMTMHFTDSTITRKINAEGTNEILGTDSLTIIRKVFKISEEGKFIETK